MTEPELVERLRIVNLKPGDVLVLFHPGRIAPPMRDRLSAVIAEHLPGHPVIVIEDGMDLSVLRQGGIP